MALDNASRRGSAISVTMPWRANVPLPDNTIDRGDRKHVAFLYAGTPSVTTSPPTTLGPTTLAPTTVGYTTPSPTTVPVASTPPPTTLAPTTLAPTTLAPTTAAPTTFPTNCIYDDFNRGDSNPIGGNWTTLLTHNAVQIVSNEAKGTGGNSGALYNECLTDNQYCLGIVGTMNEYVGVMVRVSQDESYVYGYLFQSFTSQGKSRLYRWDGAGETQLGADYNVTVGAGEVIKLSVSGSTLTPHINGVDLATRSDSNITQGVAAIRFPGGDTTTTLDYWEACHLCLTTAVPTTLAPTTLAPTTTAPTTLAPTTLAPTTLPPTTAAPTTLAPTTTAPTTLAPTTAAPTTLAPTTAAPTTLAPTTAAPTSILPTTAAPTTPAPTTVAPTTAAPTTLAPTTAAPTTIATTAAPTTIATTAAPTTAAPVVCVARLKSTISETLLFDSMISSELNLKSTITEEITLDADLCW